MTELEAKLTKTNQELAAKIERLQLELAILKHRMFGRSREHAELLERQGQLFEAPSTVEVDPAPAPSLPRTPKTEVSAPAKPRREVIPEGLRRETRLLDLPEEAKVGLVKIGEDASERLACTPGEFYVIRTVRPRYADPVNPDAGVQQVAVPPSIIPGGILDETVIQDVAISKFADHMPLSRQIERCGRVGVTLALSTLSENLLTVAEVWLKPLRDALWQILRTRSSLHVDETVLPTLPDKKSTNRQTQKTRLWTYLNDQAQPIILFHYTETKAGAHVQTVLADWFDSNDPDQPRYLHADAASNYEALYRLKPHIRAVNCWAHARRKFYAIAQESPGPTFAHEMVGLIDQLFAFECDWKPLSDAERAKLRQSEAVPHLERIRALLEAKLIRTSPNSPTAQAIAYLLKRWVNFTSYTERGDLNLSNNAAERALRKAALGRKNFLFVGNERGGEAAAIYYSLIETAKANGINPSEWLLNTLRELPNRKNSTFHHVKDLLPIQGASEL